MNCEGMLRNINTLTLQFNNLKLLFTCEMKFLPLPVQPCMLKTKGLLGDGFLGKWEYWMIFNSHGLSQHRAWPLTARTTKSWAICCPTRFSESKVCSLKKAIKKNIKKIFKISLLFMICRPPRWWAAFNLKWIVCKRGEWRKASIERTRTPEGKPSLSFLW